jgi:spore coat polysaccharide biosynthesis protein SpsF (cytidylyltransferase family)
LILLQARTSSTRLPAKILLPVAGLPVVVLAAQRAANTGREVQVLTSTKPSDDLLVSILDDYKVSYFRGELANVLQRFVDATSDLDDDAIVVRLTADNLFPDGWFIDRMIEVFQDGQLDYLSSVEPECGLPYGMSVEITRAGLLREALASSSAPEELEHVTPFIHRRYGVQNFLGLAHLNLSNYRCTIDTLEDYLKVAKIFRLSTDPVLIPSQRLIEQLVEAS